MGLLGFLGNAGDYSKDKATKEIQDLMIPNEDVELAFKTIRDKIIFTNLRLIVADVQGVTGSKVEYLSIPYSKINRFSVESRGTFDLDSEIKIWCSSSIEPTVSLQFSKNSHILDINRAISAYTLL